jgi:putative transcription factor
MFINAYPSLLTTEALTMSSCELCGRSMKGKGRSMIIEGASMILCPQCAERFGDKSVTAGKKPPSSTPRHTSWTGAPQQESPQIRPPPRRVQTFVKPKPHPKRAVTLDEMILIEDYARVIRDARQKAKVSQEQLAQKVGERISTLQGIEAGRLKPVEKTIRGLERELGISLLEPIGPAPISFDHDRPDGSATLGDVVKVKRRKANRT